MDKKKGKGFCKLPKKVQKKISPKNAASCDRPGYSTGGRAQIAGFGKARH